MVKLGQARKASFSTTILILLLLLSTSLVQLLILPEAAGKTMKIGEEYYNDSDRLIYYEKHTLAANGTDIFHVRIREASRFDERPKRLHWGGGANQSANLSLFLIRGHRSERTGEEEFKLRTLTQSEIDFLYYTENISLDGGGGQKFTLFVETNESGPVDYQVFFALYVEPGASRLLYYGLRVMGIFVVTVMVATVLWVRHYNINYRKSLRSVRFTPHDLVLRWRRTLPRYRSGVEAAGRLVPGKSQRYVSKPGDSTACCPSCKQVLGTKENPYQYTRIHFLDVGSPTGQRKVWRCLAVYCDSCNKLLDVAK